MSKKILPILVFCSSLSLIFIGIGFVAGFVTKSTNSGPTYIIETAYGYFSRLMQTGHLVPNGLLVERPQTSSNKMLSGVAASDNRLRAFMGYSLDSKRYEVWLYRGDEKIVTWPIGGSEVTNSLSLLEKNPHAMQILRDGTVMLSFTAKEDTMVRINACGEVLWHKDGFYHHSFDLDEYGNVWTWLGPTSSYDQNQIIVAIDPLTGEHVEEIDFIETVLRSGDNLDILGLPQYFWEGEQLAFEDRSSDVFHPNDVEVLDTRDASAFPMFSAGDLLVSLRNLNFVGVISRESSEITWGLMGPWRRQHDPDFLSNGAISVYNNNFLVGPPYETRTNVILVNPESGQIDNIFTEKEPHFFSATMGKHQWLSSSIVHITLPKEGRSVEVDINSGEIIFEFNNIATDNYNGVVANSIVLDEDFFDEEPALYACESN